jgi:hypothetical protein
MFKKTYFTHRNIHRDFSYFFVGLIIAFSVSGIALNHREDFDPQEYIVKAEKIQLDLSEAPEKMDDAFIKNAIENIPILEEEAYRGFRNRGNEIHIFFENAFAFADTKSGAGEVEFLKTIPLLGQMTILHKTTDVWWIWFSDIFGLALLTIAITGMFIGKGKFSFQRRGWILAVAGLIFPFVFLFLIR